MRTMPQKRFFALAALVPMAPVGLFALGAGCATAPGEQVGEADEHLTPAQCLYFDVNGKDTICHYTGSASHPYTIVKTSDQACIDGHSGHAGDYVAVNDPTCQGGGCLPSGAPCDATLPCCDGFSCQSGVCTPNVSDHCSPSPCQNGSTCVTDASGYTCQCLPGYTGTNCDIDIDECASQPCFYGNCLDGINSYQCDCAPGFTGANCDIDIDECESNPCYHGACIDQVNGYVCDCAPGFTGTYCEEAVSTGYDCEGNNPCTQENIDQGLFLFPASASPSQFIQCSEWGQCYVMSCPPGSLWDNNANTCL